MTSRRLTAVFAFLAAAGLAPGGLGLTACHGKAEGKSQQAPAVDAPKRSDRRGPETEEIGWLTVRLENRPPGSLMTVKPENLPAHVKSLYRLRPDRRFLYAAAEVQRLMAGKPRSGTLDIRLEENRWRLSLDGSPIGDLPDLPGFADAKTFLVAWARSQPAFKGTAGSDPLDAAGCAALENGLPSDLFPALARLDAAWEKTPGDPALVVASLRGFLWLALQTFDELELSDPILGKALALFAIAEARDPGQFARQESLLASLLGYEDHAQLSASSLPEGDPVRLFADWDVAGLKVLAHRAHPEPRTEYLYLLRLARSHVKEAVWFHEFEPSSWGAQLDSPSLRLVLTLAPFSQRSGPATLMETQVLDSVSPASRVAGTAASVEGGRSWRGDAEGRLEALRENSQKPPESRLSELEEAVQREASRREGALLDRQTVQAFYLANFYSSVHYEARYDLDSLGTTEGAEEFGKSISNPPAGTAAELKDWILHRAQLRHLPDSAGAVAADLSRLRHIGVAPLSRLSEALANSRGAAFDHFKRAFVPSYFDRLDSRPSSLHAAFRTASELLNDLAIVESCMRPAAARSPRELDWDLPWALRFLGDRERLTAVASDKTWPPGIRSRAVEELAALEKTEPRILIDRFRALIREDATESTPLWAAVDILEKEGQIDGALQLIDEWLTSHTEPDLPKAGVLSLKSRLLRKQGRIKEAWPIAQTAARSGKEGCLEEKALALIDLGRLNEALDTARQTLDHYGSDSAVALVAQILWMKGNDDEAARLLTSPEKPIADGVWGGYLSMAFDEAFAKADDARAEAAFDKLVVPSVSTLKLVWFVGVVTKKGRPSLSVKLAERLHGREPSGWVTGVSYLAIRKARGSGEARDWLRAHATPADLDIFAKQAFSDGDYEQVWDLPDHPEPTKNEILYMIRAACLLYQPEASDERRTRLLAFFRSRPKKDFVVYGLSLLGEVDRETLFAQIKDPTYLCSIGWILALTSAHEGRYEEANAWLQVSMEAGSDVPPRLWAGAIYSRWFKEGRTLSELARRRIY